MIGNTESRKRTVRRAKRRHMPEEPDRRENIVLPYDYQVTHGLNEFLIHDNGVGNDNRILIFASSRALEHLSRAEVWHMDGNFSLAPSVFKQLYVIRSPLDQSAVSCIYALLPAKNEMCYEELFRSIALKFQQMELLIHLNRVVMDFEKSAINAIRTVFGVNLEITGCFFHLFKSVMRKIQKTGLTQFYNDADGVAKLFIGQLIGLSFVPVGEVVDAFNTISEHS